MKCRSAQKAATLIIASAIFIISFRYIVASFRWTDIIPILEQASLIYLIGGGAISIIIYWLLRTMRLFILLKNLGVQVRFTDLYLCSAVSLGFSIITPFQSGEALKVEMLKKYGIINRMSGYSSLAVERLIDLFVVITLATISILGIFDIGINKSIAIYLWFALMILLISGALAIKKIKNVGRIGDYIRCMGLCISNFRMLFVVVILTVCSWIVVAIGWQVCLYSISVNIGLQKSMALMSTVSIINVLSFIPSALGVSEASIAEVLMRFGLCPASAQAGALVLRFYGILALFLSAIHLIVWNKFKYMRDNNDSKS